MNIIKVFVNGSFDVLHTGHLKLLNYAKSQGDYLLVAIDSDRRISEKKGPDRPFNNEKNRFALMSNLKPVDEVKIFDSDQELIDIIKEYAPDTMIVGSDWRLKTVIGQEYAKEIKFFERVNDESTTKTIQRYLDRR
jgi:D-beta-D-heptose 7-phosphate kinase/D-beta-D-heptose 1-phosphate adenosyltransferase